MYSKTSMKHRVLLKGQDAADLLHRISTIDVKRLKSGANADLTPGLILSPQGKIVTYFELMKITDSELEIRFEPPFLELLDQFTFAEKYEIENLPLLPEQASDEKTRILSLRPLLGKEFKNDGQTNPLEINLRSAIHDNKGCYPGQEVIEKIISLGSPAKKLCLLEGTNLEPVPTPLLDSETGAEVGTLTSFENGVGLGILKRTHQKIGIKLQTKTGVLALKE